MNDGFNPHSDYRGFRGLLGFKYYFRAPRTFRTFLAAEGGYSRVFYDTEARFYAPGDTAAHGTPNRAGYYTDRFKVDKQKSFFTARGGFQLIKSRFVLDVPVGAGLKGKTTVHADRDVPGDSIEGSQHPNAFIEADREAYRETVGSYQGTVSLGCRF